MQKQSCLKKEKSLSPIRDKRQVKFGDNCIEEVSVLRSNQRTCTDSIMSPNRQRLLLIQEMRKRQFDEMIGVEIKLSKKKKTGCGCVIF